ncbi:DUF4190 domain-containing protein [Streptomyces sp. NBC_01317]|uniref:DUF4190 domain-containing protein n=1 Tax=Streptomyces sp. NBC_01317 TaxID=2903822 RepID=UPI002E12F51B|nr:DUF4190 domain-containing protein [Streptomyces sp. NBC_01317]
MPDQSDRPPGGFEDNDPWAPPERRVPLDKQAPGSVHDQPTVIGGPLPGAVPPPPPAPGGPGAGAPGPYGYPGAPPGTVPPQPGAPYGPPYATGTGGTHDTGAGYGYPAAGPPTGATHTGYPAGGYVAPYPGYGAGGWQQAPSNGMGVTALVLGIVGLVVGCFWGVGILLGVLALIFGIIGRRKARRGEATNGGVALAGVILGAVATVLGAVFLALLIWVVNSEEGSDFSDEDPFSTSSVVLVTP